MSGWSFDVGTMLGIGDSDSSPMDVAIEGEILLRVANGLSVASLDERGFLGSWHWYREKWWYRTEVQPGNWLLRIPIPNTTSTWNWEVEKFFLAQGEFQLSAPLAIAALQCVQAAGYEFPLEDEDVLRCPVFGNNACVHRMRGKFFLGKLDWDAKGPYTWAGGARLIS